MAADARETMMQITSPSQLAGRTVLKQNLSAS
jgi:hypothetical protein